MLVFANDGFESLEIVTRKIVYKFFYKMEFAILINCFYLDWANLSIWNDNDSTSNMELYGRYLANIKIDVIIINRGCFYCYCYCFHRLFLLRVYEFLS